VSAIRPAGDRAVLVEVPEASVARVARALGALEGVVDVVPGHCTVLVVWQDSASVGELRAAVEIDAPVETRLVEIPVTYDGEDLELVASLTELSVEEVIAAHTGSEYTAAFLGFQPGFAYLVGGDERLHVPRRDEPRQRVPAGSVAVAGPYSGVYPRVGPGGWRLLGTTDETMFDAARTPPALLAAGDRVRFVAQ
jgi:KipI family sensor histidine kinase inhibitor